MKVIVLGAGVIGISTAYYLARAGAEVTVIERQPGPALETSFANAGQVSPGYAAPWATPSVPFKVVKWLLQRHSPLSFRADGSLWQWQWVAHMLGNCTSAHYLQNKSRMLRLAEYSRHCLQQLRAEIGIEYEQRTGGTLQLFRTQAQLDASARDVEVLKQFGVDFRLLDRDGCALAEPALATSRHKLSGGLHLPHDETGDCLLFTQRLAAAALALGVTFRYQQAADGLVLDSKGVAAVQLGAERLTADHYVVALGSYSRPFLQSTGLQLPVYPVKGYSLTMPILRAEAAPVSTVLDESYKVAITRFDQRIRTGGMAELAGFDLRLNPKRRQTLEMVVDDLFPGSADTAAASFWTGLRPMTPDGTPIVGGTQHPNLWLNTGHGTLGWTMGCGSGKVIADLICGSQPEIAVHDLSLQRYQ